MILAADTTLSEHGAIERLRAGDPTAFATIYNLHKRRVFNLCLRISGNRAVAEELTQEAFLNVFRKVHTFRGEAAFSTWLHRIAANCALMYVREQKSRIVETPLQEFEETEDGHQRETVGRPDATLSHCLDRVELEHAIDQLPPGYRLVLVLHDIEGYEHSEIAELLGCSVGNTKSQLHKARLKLRKVLMGQKEHQAVAMPPAELPALPAVA